MTALLLYALVLSLHYPQVAASSQAATAPPAPAAVAPPSFVLKIVGGLHGTVEIKAAQIEAKSIIDRLKAEVKVPIHATALVARHKVDLSLKGASLSQVLTALAPVALADIEVSGNRESDVWKAIHLLGYNEKEPVRAIEQVGFLVAAGITDDESVTAEDMQAKADTEAAKGLEGEPKDAEKPMLAVAVKDGRVSVRARRQNLAVLLNEVATRGAIAFDIRGNVDMNPIDIELRDTPLVDLPLALGRAGVRLVLRRNLATGEEVAQGIRLGDGH